MKTLQKYKELPDEVLVEHLRMDDKRAFTALYERYWERLFHVAAQTLDSAEEAEECVQDIFYSLWSRREALELKHSIHTYLSVAVKYKVIDRLNKKHKNKQMLAEAIQFMVTDAPCAESYLLEKELLVKLERTISLLPEKCRIVYQLSREKGKSHKQIAEELQISEKTVNNHLVRALRDIKDSITSVIPML